MYHFVVLVDIKISPVDKILEDQVDIDVFTKGNIGYFDDMVEEGDTSIAIDQPGLAQAEDIFGRSVGAGQKEGTKQRVALRSGLVEANVGDFLGGGVYLPVVVAVDLIS